MTNLPFESLTTAQVNALSPPTRAAYERWFWRWLNGTEAEDTFDIETEQREGYAYDKPV